ncbi:MAG TPA: uroporphyrinogen-III synthase [Terriglobales bacterium]
MSKEKPLRGVRVLVGRARHQASALSTGLKKLGADVIEIPFIEIRKPRSYKPLDAALRRIQEYDWLILTSANGVEALAARLKQLRIPRRKLMHLAIAAIGPATRDQIRKIGLQIAVVPKRYVAESVVESLQGRVRGKRVLVARAKVARDVIPRELRKLGARVEVVEAYETVVPESSRRQLMKLMRDPKTRPDVVTFTSSSTARNFVALLGGQECPPNTGLDGVRLASIGPITSDTLRELGLPVHMEAEEFTIPGLIRAIESSQGD